MNSRKTKTLFFGSGRFAVIILSYLLKSHDINLVAVVTQPDKKVGRKRKITPTQVKQFLLESNEDLEILQPENLAGSEEEILSKVQPELIIVADYGKMIPIKTINYPKYKCLNVHGSLLPDLRGAVPIPMAILKGYKETGVSIPIMTKGLDDGDVIAFEKTTILDIDTTKSLKERIGKQGGVLLLKTIPKWIAGKITPKAQNHDIATITKKTDIAKDKACFDKTSSFLEVDRKVRAFYPWPVAWTKVRFHGKERRLKVYKGKIQKEKILEKSSGNIYKANNRLFIALDDGHLELIEIQLEGKKRDLAGEYLYLDGTHIF